MGHWQTDWDRDALKRIVALLFALANLADLAAGAPFLRRRRVLGILNWGETEARAFLIGMACGEPVPAEALEPGGDAADLATRLRALALMLTLLMGRPFISAETIHPRAAMRRHEICRPMVRRLAALALPAPDTS
jgi:hypothetical protein